MKKILFLFFFFDLGLFAFTQNNPTNNSRTIILTVINNLDIGFGNSYSCNEHMSFVVNGPLLNEDLKPLGGWIDNGIQKKDWVNPNNYTGNFSIDNGIFGVDKNGKPFLVRYEYKHYIPQNIQWAFQNGLILVENSRNIRGNSTTKYPRSGIGFNKDGDIFIIISVTPITLRNFAQLFVNEGCINAIYLDGGPYVGFSAQNYREGFVKEAIKLQFYHQE